MKFYTVHPFQNWSDMPLRQSLEAVELERDWLKMDVRTGGISVEKSFRALTEFSLGLRLYADFFKNNVRISAHTFPFLF